MGYYDAYNAILSVTNLTPRDRNTDVTKRAFISNFKNSPSYYQVQITTSSTPTASTPVDAWIVTEKGSTKETMEIILIPNQVLNYGDMVFWSGANWITTMVDFMGNIYYRGSMQKCYSSLKWLDSGGATKTASFIITSETQRGIGLNEGKIMFLPDERRYIAVQYNVDTLKIVKGQRFILDNNRVWQVVSINTIITGLIHLELQENTVDPSKDRTDLRIADYTQNPPPTGGNLW